MTWFIDLRSWPSGGEPAPAPTLVDEHGSRYGSAEALFRDIRNRDVVLVTHGFNVPQTSGLFGPGGLVSLDGWRRALDLGQNALFVGVLWPGDSVYLPLLDYPVELQSSMRSAQVLAPFLDAAFGEVRSISFVSHSLGARLVLQTVNLMKVVQFSTLVLMAAAIEDDCLIAEFRPIVSKISRVYIMASRRDAVLQFAFPLGNPPGDLLAGDHPYVRTALGRSGPKGGVTGNKLGIVTQIPDSWNFGHLDYLPNGPISPLASAATPNPGPNDPCPLGTSPPPDWKTRWAASVVSLELAS